MSWPRIVTYVLMSMLICSASGQLIQMGAEAPSLAGGKWIAGREIVNFSRGRVYVVSFWYSADGERADALPTMLQIAQANAKDVICVCVSADGKDSEEFRDLQRKGAPENIRVLKDNPDDDVPGPVVQRWLQGVRERSYPLTFIVDKQGNICFAGDILEAKALVGDVVSGKRSVEQLMKEMEAYQNDFDKSQTELSGRAAQRAAEGDYAGAASAMDAIIEKYPSQRVILLRKKFDFLLQAERFDEAYKITDDLLELQNFDAEELNELAWFMVDETWITQRDLDRALRISQRSNDLSGNRVGAYVDTLARVYYEKGEIEKALELQTKAVALADSDAERQELLPALERYRNAFPK